MTAVRSGLVRRPARLPEAVPAGTPVLAAYGVDVRIDGVRVVEGVDLELHAGEVLALVGPNGAGKSSLLAALSGDRHVSAGRVELAGAELSSWRPVEMALRRAVMLQQTAVAFPFTVREVAAMGRAPWAGTELEDDDDALVAAALDETDTAHLAERTVTSLSGGEQARAAFARAVAQQTGILLLDEPTASLDILHQEMIMRLVRGRARLGAAAAVVLHDLNLAAAHADRVAVLAAGRLVAHGPPAEVFTAELLSRVYGHPVEVLPHPRTGIPLVLPVR